MTKNKGKKYSLTDFFVGYFENVGKLTLANLMICVPMAFFGGIIYVLSLFGLLNIFSLFLFIPLISPFVGGLFYVCLKVVRGQKLSLFKDYIKGIKENALYFFLDSLIFYFVGIGMFITFSYYRTGIEGAAMFISFFLSLIGLLFFICFQNNILTMSVSVKLKFSEIIKNSVVLVVTGLFGHFKTILSISLIAIILYTMNVVAGNAIVILIVGAISTLFFLPVLCTYIIVFNTYQAIEKQIVLPYQEETENAAVKKSNNFSEITPAEIKELRVLAKGPDDEYVSFRGRMLRRSTIRRLIENHSDVE